MAHKGTCGPLLAILLLSSVGAGVAQSPVDQSTARSAAPRASRLAGDWRSSPLVTIPASKPPAAYASLGAALPGTRLERMLLLLEPSPAQQRALTRELENQQDSASSRYHHWLTPTAFADAYGNSTADVAAIFAWLSSEGFKVAPLPASRGWIEFLGTVAQVEQAFHTTVSSVATADGTRAVLADTISVPAAIQPLVHGLVSLDGAVSAPAMTAPKPVTATAAELAVETSMSHAEAFSPRLLAQLLHLDALHSAGQKGSGQAIAIAARSSVNSDDIAAFRSTFGLPASPLTISPNGPDPGRTSDEAEAVLAVSWAGATAPGAQIVLVPAATTGATDGLDLALAAIVDQALAHTVAVGYSACEAALSESHQAFYAAIYRQAAAEGIAVIAATGDSGPAACHAAGSDKRVSSGYGVNALASTPWNTAVGVAALGAGGAASALAAWSPVNPADPAYAGGGGSSAIYAAPGWQPIPPHSLQGTGVYNRLLPDVTLPSAIDSGVNRGLAFCLSNSATSTGCTLVRSGGSSAAAALFAGIAALVAEKNGPQGNLGPSLYPLSRVNGVFNDVQQGAAKLPCVPASPGCGSSGQIGFAASAGFDQATGLGSLDAQALVNQWTATPQVGAGNVSAVLSVSPQEPNSTYNPSALVTLTTSIFSQTGGGTPTGTIVLVNSSSGLPLPTAPTTTLDGNGNASLTLNLHTIFSAQGSFNIAARYSGDVTYKQVSSPPLTITTEQSFTLLTVLPSTTQPTPGETITVTVTAGVLTTSGPPAGANPPTGLVTLNLTGGPTSPSYTAALTTQSGTTAASFSFVVPPGQPSYSLQATYPGDANYGGSTSSPVTITLTKGGTTSSVSPATPSPFAFSPLQLTATVTALNAGSSLPSGTFTFTVNGVPQAPATLIPGNPSMATLTITTPGPGNYTVAGSYAGDANYSGSTATGVGFGVQKSPTTLTVIAPTTSPTAGATFQVTVNLAPQFPGSTLPTGNVTVTVDGTGQTTGALVSGATATVTLTAPSTTGQHNLQASYPGDTNYSTSTSASVSFIVAKSPTTTVVTTSPPTATVGDSLQVTASVTPTNAGTSQPSGSVSFTVDRGVPIVQPVTPGSPSTATATVPLLTAGTHTAVGTYSGDSFYASSTSAPVTFAVAKGATVTTVTATPSTLTVGTTETLAATVAPINTVAGTIFSLTGTVTFLDNGATILGKAPVASNTATLSGIALSGSLNHSITAVYSGDVNWLPSSSTPLALLAITQPDIVVLTANLSTVGPGQAVILTATVTPTSTPALTGEQNPTGNVVFYNGTTVLGESPLAAALLSDSSVATLTLSTLPGGQDTVYAVYLGDLFYDAETSNLLTLTVQDFTITPAPSNPGTNLTIVQGSSGTASFVITGLGGFNNMIQVVCAVPSQDYMTCTASPQQVTPTATVTFVVQTFDTGSAPTASNRKPDPRWPRALGGAALALLAFFVLPFGRRARIFSAGRDVKRFLILVLLLAGLAGAGIGCNSTISGGVTGTGGTPLGVATLKITASNYLDNTVIGRSIFLTVNVVPKP